VDLKEPANAGKSRDSRFLRKILTDAEIDFVKNAQKPDEALWSLWTCKETAYKVIKKSFPETTFIPRRWQAFSHKTQTEYSEGEVLIPERRSVSVRLFSNPNYVHCVGADNLKTLDKLIWRVEALPLEEEKNQSLFLRNCLAMDLATNYSLNFHQIKIKRTRRNGELEPPRVYVDGKKTDIDVSLSHDGRFVAYAFNDIR
jgi:phosphopantetheinyl transferase (holo-ACP synthase)